MKAFLTAIFSLLFLCSQAQELQRSVSFTNNQVLYPEDLHTLIDSTTILPTFYLDKPIQTSISSNDVLLLYNNSASRYYRVSAFNALFNNTNRYSSTRASTNLSTLDSLELKDGAAGDIKHLPATNVFPFVLVQTNMPNAASVVSFPHFLGATPIVTGVAVCTNSIYGYNVGDEIDLSSMQYVGYPAYMVSASSTNINVAAREGSDNIQILRRSAPIVWTNQSTSNWMMKIYIQPVAAP